MAETVNINKAQLKRIRKEKGFSIKQLSDYAFAKNLRISTSTLDRMESEKYNKEIKLKTVKLVAELLEVPAHEIIKIEAGFIDSVDLAPLTNGKDLKELIDHKSAKLVFDVFDEPSDVNAQNKILESIKLWEVEATRSDAKHSQLQNIERIFEYKNQLLDLKSLGVNVLHGKSYEISAFDVIGGWERDEYGSSFLEPTIKYLSLRPELLDEAQRYSEEYIPDPDGFGAQQVNILVFSQNAQNQVYEYETNPYGFTAHEVKIYKPDEKQE